MKTNKEKTEAKLFLYLQWLSEEAKFRNRKTLLEMTFFETKQKENNVTNAQNITVFNEPINDVIVEQANQKNPLKIFKYNIEMK